MNKIASYLRGHLRGEVLVRSDILEKYSTDGGVLSLKPEIVIRPSNTADIRKIMRFSWQLAEKGHILPVTARGMGRDHFGSSIGSGVVIDMATHMNQVLEYDAKQRYVRLQPGMSLGGIQSTLGLYGTGLPSLSRFDDDDTVGGVLASANPSVANTKQTLLNSVDQLEVVLASGDVIQTQPINKRQFDKLKGQQGFVGDIYRGIDKILEEHAETIAGIKKDEFVGYDSIVHVRKKDGSIDLAPLFLGSQGTLGVIAEIIMKAEYRSLKSSAVVLVFDDPEKARDSLDIVKKMSPTGLDYFDASLFDIAGKSGRVFNFYEMSKKTISPKVVVIARFEDFNERKRMKFLKNIKKAFLNDESIYIDGGDDIDAQTFIDGARVLDEVTYGDKQAECRPRLFEGFSVPNERFEDFSKSIEDLSKKEHIDLPLAGDAISGIYGLYPSLDMSKTGDKQKVFKLLDSMTKLVDSHGGAMTARSGEGRLISRFVYSTVDDSRISLYEDIKKLFDPHGILNPGVKQENTVTVLAKMINSKPNN